MRYEKLEKTLIENTETQKCIDNDDTITAYLITPENGFVIHTKFHDDVIYDENGNDIVEKTLGYTASHILILSDYDFDANPYEIYAVRKENAYR